MIEILILASLVVIAFWKRSFEWIASSLFVGFIAAFVLAIVASLSSNEHHRTDCSQRIKSVRNGTEWHGSFFLGSGYIGESEYYFTFAEERGGLRRVQLPAKFTYVFQDETNAPYMSWQIIHYRITRWLVVWPSIEHSEETMRDLHVPPETIVCDFKIN